MNIFKRSLILTVGSLAFAMTLACHAESLNQRLQGTLDNFLGTVNQQLGSNLGMSMSVYVPWKSKNKIYNFASGYTSRLKWRKVKPNNLFEIGSITKSFTSAIVLQLQSEGKLSLDDTVGKYFPQFTRWKDIKIYQLLNMTSGINNGMDEGLINEVYHHRFKIWTPEKFVERTYNKNKDEPIGQYYYSNAAYQLAGMIIAKVTGKSFAQVLNERILDNQKYDWNDSIFYWNKPFYRIQFGLRRRLVPGYCYCADYDPPFKYGKYVYENNFSIGGPSGGLIATTADEVKWYKHLFVDKNVLSDSYIKEMTKDYNVKVTTNNWYGLGVVTIATNNIPGIPDNYKIIFYVGSTLVYSSIVFYSPEDQFIGAASINTASDKVDFISLLFDTVRTLLQDRQNNFVQSHI